MHSVFHVVYTLIERSSCISARSRIRGTLADPAVWTAPTCWCGCLGNAATPSRIGGLKHGSIYRCTGAGATSVLCSSTGRQLVHQLQPVTPSPRFPHLTALLSLLAFFLCYVMLRWSSRHVPHRAAAQQVPPLLAAAASVHAACCCIMAHWTGGK